jgi:hypothetical protein
VNRGLELMLMILFTHSLCQFIISPNSSFSLIVYFSHVIAAVPFLFLWVHRYVFNFQLLYAGLRHHASSCCFRICVIAYLIMLLI